MLPNVQPSENDFAYFFKESGKFKPYYSRYNVFIDSSYGSLYYLVNGIKLARQGIRIHFWNITRETKILAKDQIEVYVPVGYLL